MRVDRQWVASFCVNLRSPSWPPAHPKASSIHFAHISAYPYAILLLLPLDLSDSFPKGFCFLFWISDTRAPFLCSIRIFIPSNSKADLRKPPS